MSVVRRRPRATVLALVAIGLACSRRDDGESAHVIRLIDRLAEARVTAAVDLTKPGELAQRSEALAAEPFTAAESEQLVVLGRAFLATLFAGLEHSADAPSRVSVVTDDDGSRVVLDGPNVLLRVVPHDRGGSIRAELRFRGEVAPRERPFFVELSEPLTIDELKDETAIVRRLFPQLKQRHFLELEVDADAHGFRRGLATFSPHESTRSLLFVAAARGARLELDDLKVARQPRVLADLLAPSDEFEHPLVRRIQANGVYREAILLPAPSELSLRLRLPERDPELECFVAPILDGAERVTVHVEVLGSRGRTSAASTGSTERTWEPLRVALRDAGEVDVRIRVESTGEAGGAPAVAIGTPTIIGRPRGPLPPDVILVSIDTVRRDRLSLYGAPRPTSPRLAEIGAEAAVFETAIAPAPWTLPSHVSVFTGQYPLRHGVDEKTRRLDGKRAHSLAETFRARGYETAAFTAAGFVHPDFGLATGFERYGTEELVQCDFDHGRMRRRATTPERDDLLARLGRERRRPLFLFVHTYGAHNYQSSHDDLGAIGVPSDQVAAMSDLLRPDAAMHFMTRWDQSTASRDEIAWFTDLYDASLRGVDALVGDVYDALRASGRLDAAYLGVFSDHGEELYEHGRFGHDFHLSEELIRVPLLLRGPGIPAGRHRDVVSLTDVAPTIHELLGLPVDDRFDGHSLVPLLRGRAFRAEPVLAQVRSQAELHALRNERMKLIATRVGERFTARVLFDLAADPGENRDVAATEPELARQVESALAARVAELARRAAPPSELSISPERARELEAMGYLGGK